MEYTSNYGCLVKDENTHELLHYTEKPETFVSDLINSGTILFIFLFLFLVCIFLFLLLFLFLFLAIFIYF